MVPEDLQASAEIIRGAWETSTTRVGQSENKKHCRSIKHREVFRHLNTVQKKFLDCTEQQLIYLFMKKRCM